MKQHPGVCQNAKEYLQNKKNIKFWTKNVLFGYFRPEFEKLLPNLKSAPSNLSKYEDSRKANSRNTNLKLKLPYVGVFGLIFEINYCHIRKSAPANLDG